MIIDSATKQSNTVMSRGFFGKRPNAVIIEGCGVLQK
jgi:hypothetical protein